VSSAKVTLHSRRIALALAFMVYANAACAGDLSVDLAPDPNNPSAPRMGDNLLFHSDMRNSGPVRAEGIIAWLSLVQVDPGAEQPVDLEDWSAQKAVTATKLEPGETMQAEWRLRLIQAGSYRVLVSITSGSGSFVASPFIDFTVREKPVVDSVRVLPVAIGLPLLIVAAIIVRLRTG
jgi:hypothetical protein